MLRVGRIMWRRLRPILLVVIVVITHQTQNADIESADRAVPNSRILNLGARNREIRLWVSRIKSQRDVDRFGVIQGNVSTEYDGDGVVVAAGLPDAAWPGPRRVRRRRR